MPKQSQIEKIIAELEEEIRIRQFAIAKLRAQQQQQHVKPVRKAKVTRIDSEPRPA
jgi:hypothetical protein